MMGFDWIKVFFIFFAFLIIPTNIVFAHHDICQICDTPSDITKYREVEFTLYIPATESDKVISFLQTVNNRIILSQIREISVTPDARLIDENSQVYLVRGSILFSLDLEASATYSDLLTFITANRNQIDYGVLRLTDNTNHYPNPLPDTIQSENIVGVRTNLDRYAGQV